MKTVMNWLAALVLVMIPWSAEAALLGPSAYNTAADSPFSPFAGFAFFHLETFDDHLLNTPGVTASTGNTAANVGFNGAIIDQVGSPGGCPGGGLAVACDTWFSSAGASGVSFTFNAAVLGALPNAAGLVWTDGAGTITFEAFDENGLSLGVLNGAHADGSFLGTTDEDRFYGITSATGISRIFISNSSGGIEIDHLQYGLRGTQPPAVPEPATLTLLGSGLTLLAATALRHRRS